MRFTDLMVRGFRRGAKSAVFHIFLISLMISGAVHAENAAFDLIGPRVEVRV